MIKNLESNLNREMFPDPTRRGIAIEPVCHDIEIYIWLLLLNHLTTKQALSVTKKSVIGFQNGILMSNKTFQLSNAPFGTQRVAITGDTPGVITYDFPGNKTYIMRVVLETSKTLSKVAMQNSLEKREIEPKIKLDLAAKIESKNSDWFVQVMLTMLGHVGIQLTAQETAQLIANIQWFNQNYRSEM